VLLDESIAGVDPVTQRWMWKFTPDNMTGRTVLLTTKTNVMDEASLCKRIGIMANHQMRGRTPEELKSRYVQHYSVVCHLVKE